MTEEYKENRFKNRQGELTRCTELQREVLNKSAFAKGVFPVHSKQGTGLCKAVGENRGKLEGKKKGMDYPILGL